MPENSRSKEEAIARIQARFGKPSSEGQPPAPGAEQAATGKRLRKASAPVAPAPAASTSPTQSRRPPPPPPARPAATPATSAARPAATPPPPSRPSSPPASGPFGKFEFDLDGPGEGSPPPAAAPAPAAPAGRGRDLDILAGQLQQQAAARGPAAPGSTVRSPGTFESPPDATRLSPVPAAPRPRTVATAAPAPAPSPAPAPAPAATPLFGSLKRPASGPRRLRRWITVPAALGAAVALVWLAKEYRGEMERFLADIGEGCAAASVSSSDDNAAADDGDDKSGNDGVSTPDDSAAADDSADQASAQPQCPVPGDLELTVDDPAFSWYSGYDDLDGWKFKPNFGQGTLIVSCPNGRTTYDYSTGNDNTAKAADGDFSNATDQ